MSQSDDRQKLEELFAEFISDVPFNPDVESQHKAADKFLDSIQTLIEQSNRKSREQEVQNALTHITAREESPDDYLYDRFQELQNQEGDGDE